ncbi:hypothetical protein [Sediminitomix flava]|nr:hypothetical protein [Sediminitomix flava]
MIQNADEIVWGTISEIRESDFKVTIEGSLTGIDGDLWIKKFRDWDCASRWKEYKKGQKVFLFLRKDKENKLRVMSGGNEGELPILNDSVYINARSIIPPTLSVSREILMDYAVYKIEDQQYNLNGMNYYGVRLGFDDFVATCMYIRGCLKIEFSDQSFGHFH